jgi:hypothetical protein
MKQKEVAIKLRDKFLPIVDYGQTEANNYAKKCALIAVGEILQYIDRINETHQGSILNDADWLKVKDELNGL